MTSADYERTPAARRRSKRERQYANTLVHYLGVEQALEVCSEHMWTGVRQAILEQHDSSGATLH